MTTGKILWNAVWRGAVWGTLGGLVPALLLALFFRFPYAGSVLPIGFLGGLVIGTLGGVLFGVLTRSRFFPLQQTETITYQRTIGVASIILGTLVSVIAYVLLGPNVITLLITAPIIVALIVMGQLYAGWYINES